MSRSGLLLGVVLVALLAACGPKQAPEEPTSAEPAAPAMAGTPSPQSETVKPKISKQSDLPRFSYEVSAKPSELMLEPDFIATYGPRLRADTQAILDGYEIEDKSLLRDLKGTILTLDMLAGDYAAALAAIDEIRALQDKPADKLTAGLTAELIAKAKQAGGDIAAAVRSGAEARLAEMPFDVVEDNIEELKGRLEIYSPSLFTGIVQGRIDDGAMASKTISRETLDALVSYRYSIDDVLPVKDALIAPLAAYIAANKVEKPDIWAARSVDFAERQGLHEVLVAVWDSGVDVGLFGDQAWTNAAETTNGEDDDGNGFIDDVHGIAFDLKSNKVTELLYPLGEAAAREAAMRSDIKGYQDVIANIDSPEASALKTKMAGLDPAESQAFIQDLSLYSNYAHGTHVAGIVMAGNPAARLLTSRITFDHKLKPDPYLEPEAQADARALADAVEYFKANGVRVVNMSWGGDPTDIENAMEANGIEPDPEKRKERALKIFHMVSDPLKAAFASAPEILFIAAAGNSDQDVEFIEDYPAGFDLPNMVSVGAVDQAGDETSFTSYGKTVKLHANGFEVESYVPGGERLAFSGTSMAAPNAVNLAAKILAVNPDLTPPEVIRLMREHADTTADGRRFLINPKASLEAAEAMVN